LPNSSAFLLILSFKPAKKPFGFSPSTGLSAVSKAPPFASVETGSTVAFTASSEVTSFFIVIT
jgi:hypothetical protein